MTDVQSWETFLTASDSDLFLLLDGAAIPSLWDAMHRVDGNISCLALYLQTEFAELLEVSPYLAQISRRSPLLEEYRTNPLFTSAGMLFICHESLQELKNRLTKIMTVRTPSYNEMFFRFYDPEVLDLLVRAREASLLDAVCGPAGYMAWFSQGRTDSHAPGTLTIYPAHRGNHADA